MGKYYQNNSSKLTHHSGKSAEGTNEIRPDKDLVGNTMKILAHYRRLALTMRWLIRHQANAGNVEAAMNDSFTLIKFGGHLQGHGLLVEQVRTFDLSRGAGVAAVLLGTWLIMR